VARADKKLRAALELLQCLARLRHDEPLNAPAVLMQALHVVPERAGFDIASERPVETPVASAGIGDDRFQRGRQGGPLPRSRISEATDSDGSHAGSASRSQIATGYRFHRRSAIPSEAPGRWEGAKVLDSRRPVVK
jgi:hypothetical protein